MKKLLTLLLIINCQLSIVMLSAVEAQAQAPLAIPYQAVARDSSGNVIANQNISLRFSIHDVTAGGTMVYKETQSVTTNTLGLFTTNVGQGTVVTGTFATINWGGGSKFMQVEMDVAGGTNYTNMGTQQMLSVPYALNAANGNWTKTGNDISNSNSGKVGIGTATPAASALLDITSTAKGFLMPRMTTAQRDAIAGPVVGLQIFNLDDQCTDIYDGAVWTKNCGLKLTGPTTDPYHPVSNSWSNIAGFAIQPAFGMGCFSIGGKAYVGQKGTGNFWVYNPTINAWSQVADYPGAGTYGYVSFSIGGKGYMGAGTNGATYYQDFWEYDPSTNAWTQKANFAGGTKSGAVGFSIGSKGYVGTGSSGTTYYQDFWEYDPSNNAWTQKANFGGTARSGAVGFSIDNKGYIGTGWNGTTDYQDFWEYNPSTNAWTQKANFAGVVRHSAVGFSIGSKGYIGTGWNAGYQSFRDFWSFNPATNTWTRKADFGGGIRGGAVGFSIGSKGYIGSGQTIVCQVCNYSPVYYSDFEEYMDDNLTAGGYSSSLVTNTVFTGPQGIQGPAGPQGIQGVPGIISSISQIGNSPNANGATINGSVLNLEPADATNGGVVTTGTQTFAGAKTFAGGLTTTGTGSITSSGGGIGYATGAGGTITQLTSRSTAVTLNKLCGTITLFSAAQASQAVVSFTLTNSFIAATDFILVQHISATNAGAWQFSVVPAAGSCIISIRNVSTVSITEATPLRFTIIKAVTN